MIVDHLVLNLDSSILDTGIHSLWRFCCFNTYRKAHAVLLEHAAIIHCTVTLKMYAYKLHKLVHIWFSDIKYDILDCQ